MSVFARVSMFLLIGLGAACGEDDVKQGDTTTPADTAATDGTASGDATTTTDATTATDATTTTDATTATDATTTTDATTATDATTTTDAAGDTSVSPATCEGTDDCTYCTLAAAPASTDDCACPEPCPTYISNSTTCNANQAAWQEHCAGDKWASSHECPIARCLAPDPLYCHDGTCENACLAVDCAPPDCPPEEQTTPPGECCARCVGDSACQSADDCTLCAFDKAVTSADECYCVFCPIVPMLKSECEANTKSWSEHCDPWPKPDVCPVASCIFPPPPVCSKPDGACVENPYGCTGPEDCTSCTTAVAPTNPSECACPMCPHAASIQECTDIQAAIDQYCADFDFDACPIPPCAFPGEPTCDQIDSHQCVFSRIDQ